MEVTAVAEGPAKGTVRTVALNSGEKKPTRLAAAKIRCIEEPGCAPCLVYDRKSHMLAAPEKKRSDNEPERAARGTWPRLSDEQQKLAVTRQRAHFDVLRKRIPNRGMHFHETRRFFFFTDIPQQTVDKYLVPYMDKLYAMLCDAYSLDPEENLWVGKAVIVVFVDKSSFWQYEQAYFDHSPDSGAQALCNRNGDGSIVVAGYGGDDLHYFAATVVHETTHGFNFRYRTWNDLPSWLDEGMAEWVANYVTGGDSGIARKIQRSMQNMRQTRSMGGDAFFNARQIDFAGYGQANAFVGFLASYNSKATKSKKNPPKFKSYTPHEPTTFCKFINGIKDGGEWEASLKKAYGTSLEDLVGQFGASQGIPNLGR